MQERKRSLKVELEETENHNWNNLTIWFSIICWHFARQMEKQTLILLCLQFHICFPALWNFLNFRNTPPPSCLHAEKLLPSLLLCYLHQRRLRLHAFLHSVGRQSVWIIKYAHSHSHTLTVAHTDNAKQRRCWASHTWGCTLFLCSNTFCFNAFAAWGLCLVFGKAFSLFHHLHFSFAATSLPNSLLHSL